MTELYLTAAQIVYLLTVLSVVFFGAIWSLRHPKSYAVMQQPPHFHLWTALLTVMFLAMALGLFAGLAGDVGGTLFVSLIVMGVFVLGSAAMYPTAVEFDVPAAPEGFFVEHRRGLYVVAGMVLWSWTSMFALLAFTNMFRATPVELEITESGIAELGSLANPLRFLSFCCIALSAAVVEEILFRGGVQGLLEKAGLGAWPAIVGGSLIWALGHAGAYVEPHGLKEVQIFGLGLFFGYAKHRWGLGSAIGLHLLNNGLALALTPFFPVET